MSGMSRDQALAHFGVRGMKWGVRKKSSKKSSMDIYDKLDLGASAVDSAFMMSRTAKAIDSGVGPFSSGTLLSAGLIEGGSLLIDYALVRRAAKKRSSAT